MSTDEPPSPWRQVLNLSDWTFLWAFPDDEASYWRAMGTSEFCAQSEGWPDYQERALRHLEERIVPLEQQGLTLVRNCTLADLNWALRHKRGVLLFSHCNRYRHDIEFRGGAMVAQVDIVRHVPRDFAGILDLSVCKPLESLPLAIKAVAPACGVAYTDFELTLPEWIEIYADLLSRFENGNDYFSADTACKAHFAERQAASALLAQNTDST